MNEHAFTAYVNRFGSGKHIHVGTRDFGLCAYIFCCDDDYRLDRVYIEKTSTAGKVQSVIHNHTNQSTILLSIYQIFLVLVYTLLWQRAQDPAWGWSWGGEGASEAEAGVGAGAGPGACGGVGDRGHRRLGRHRSGSGEARAGAGDGRGRGATSRRAEELLTRDPHVRWTAEIGRVATYTWGAAFPGSNCIAGAQPLTKMPRRLGYWLVQLAVVLVGLSTFAFSVTFAESIFS